MVLDIVRNSDNVNDLLPADDPILAEHAVEIRRLGMCVIDDVVAIGRHLAEARDHAPGFWLQWLESEFRWSDQTAYRYIHLFEARESSALHTLWNADLPLSGLYVLAAPNTPEEARQEIAEHVKAGEKPTVAEIRETVRKAKKAKTNGAPAESGGDETPDIVYSDAAHAADAKRAVTASTFENAVFIACQACENLNDLSPPVLPLERRNKLMAQVSTAAANLLRLQSELMEEEDEPSADRRKVLCAAAHAVEAFFASASGAEIFARIPSDPDKHKIVVRAFLDALGVRGFLGAMSDKFGRELCERVPQHIIASAIDAVIGENKSKRMKTLGR
jgi:hypothetical protein